MIAVWLLAYLSTGVLVWCVLLVLHLLHSSENWAETTVSAMIAWVMVVPGWPIILYLTARDEIRERR